MRSICLAVLSVAFATVANAIDITQYERAKSRAPATRGWWHSHWLSKATCEPCDEHKAWIGHKMKEAGVWLGRYGKKCSLGGRARKCNLHAG
jgi:hypothetical protein